MLEAACARWHQPPPAHRRKVRYRLTVALTAPRCRGPREKTHKQTSTFYIYQRPHFQLRMSLEQSPCTHVTSVATDSFQWKDESVHHHHVTVRLSARDSAMRRGHQNKTWTPGQGILPAFSTMSASCLNFNLSSHLPKTFCLDSKYKTAYF